MAYDLCVFGRIETPVWLHQAWLGVNLIVFKKILVILTKNGLYLEG